MALPEGGVHPLGRLYGRGILAASVSDCSLAARVLGVEPVLPRRTKGCCRVARVENLFTASHISSGCVSPGAREIWGKRGADVDVVHLPSSGAELGKVMHSISQDNGVPSQTRAWSPSGGMRARGNYVRTQSKKKSMRQYLGLLQAAATLEAAIAN